MRIVKLERISNQAELNRIQAKIDTLRSAGLRLWKEYYYPILKNDLKEQYNKILNNNRYNCVFRNSKELITINNQSKEEIVSIIKDYSWKLQTKRRQNKALRYEIGHFGPLYGYVYHESGLVLKKCQEKQAKLFYKDKSPKTNEFHLGIELKMFVNIDNFDAIAHFLNKVNPNLKNYITIKRDGSLRHQNLSDSYVPVEFCILTPVSQRESRIQALLEALKPLNPVSNSSCGLHVHLDARNLDISKTYEKLVTFQSLLIKMQPESRIKDMYYHRRNTSKQFNSSNDRTRYKVINKSAYWRHNTLEVRIHHGTVNQSKILNWLNLLLKIVTVPILPKRCPTSLKSINKALNLDNTMLEYVKKGLENAA